MSSHEQCALAQNERDPIARLNMMLRLRVAELEEDEEILAQAEVQRRAMLQELQLMRAVGGLSSTPGLCTELARTLFFDIQDEQARNQIFELWISLCEHPDEFYRWLAIFWWGDSKM